MSKRQLLSRFKRFDKELEKTPEVVVGVLGIPLGGEQIVEVPTRYGYVYVRLRDSQDELIQAFNDKVSPVYDLPVVCQFKGGRYVIVGRDTNRYGDWGSVSSFLPRHGSTHSFAEDGISGGDVVWVYGKQFMPYLAQPSGTGGSGNVILNGNMFLKSDGNWRYDGQTGSANLLGNKPTGSTAVFVLIYEDMESGVYDYSVGSHFASTITGTSQIAPYIPSLTNPNYNPIAAIRLVSGTSTIKWDNIYDARQFFRMMPTGSIASTFNIYDEGGLLGSVSGIDFVGTVVDASISGSRARVFITGSTGAGTSTGTIAIFDDGVYEGQASAIDFVGSGVDVSFTGTRAWVNVSGTPGASNPGVMAWDEGVPLGTGTVFNFVGANVQASISGSVVQVYVTGSVGGVGSSDPPYISAYDDGVFVGSGTSFSYDRNLNIGISGSIIHVESPVSTYQRFEQPINIGGTVFRVPDNVYASGSLGVFYDGHMQTKGVNYEELIYVSGTYQLLFSPATGTYHMVSYGVPCITQTFVTGTMSEFALSDSDSELLLDSDSEQLLDSDG